jgi:hypothetical protein
MNISECAKVVRKAFLHHSMFTRNGLNNGFYLKTQLEEYILVCDLLSGLEL